MTALGRPGTRIVLIAATLLVSLWAFGSADRAGSAGGAPAFVQSASAHAESVTSLALTPPALLAVALALWLTS